MPAHAHASLTLRQQSDALVVALDAPYFGDPLPAAAPGSVPGLWEYEVAELFLAGPGDDYLEIELGPGGHHWVLQLRAVRSVRREGLALAYEILERTEPSAGAPGRYRAVAHVPREYLPAGLCRGNAYLIHGAAGERCHHAHAPLPGVEPDFHQPSCFIPIRLSRG